MLNEANGEPAVDIGPVLADVLFTFPADAQLIAVGELAPRVQAALGPVAADQMVITRPGFRVTNRLVSAPLAELVREFSVPSLIADAVARFAHAKGRDPFLALEESFDALERLIDGRVLVPSDSAEAQVSPPTFACGQACGDYQIDALVHAVNDTEVYRAFDPTGRLVALKVSQLEQDPALTHEAAILQHLDGRDSPRLLESGVFRGRAFLAMEWRQGVPVLVAAQRARLAGDQRKLHGLARTLATAFGRLHAAGVVHGDIHQGNILVSPSGAVTVLDFGRAVIRNSRNLETARAGIAHYYEPEMAAALLANDRLPQANAAGEQYAVAVLIYQMVTGGYPFEPAAEYTTLLRRIVNQPVLPFTARGVPAWPALERALKRALAKAPEERFPDIRAFASALLAARPPKPAPDLPRPAAGVLAAATARIHADWPACATADDSLRLAWLALRLSLATEDEEMLVAAQLWLARAPGKSDLTFALVAAAVARAGSDPGSEASAIDRFLSIAGQVDPCLALRSAAHLLEKTQLRGPIPDSLARWAVAAFDALWKKVGRGPQVLAAALALAATGRIAPPEGLLAALADLPVIQGDMWLWCLADRVYPVSGFLAHAEAAAGTDGHALLRLYRQTGERIWLQRARRTALADVQRLAADADDATLLQVATLLAELKAAEQAEPPPLDI